MRIRQVWIRQFRNFKGDRPPISFVDEATGQVRPLTVLVGSNGSGKTTIFEVIEGLVYLPVYFGQVVRPRIRSSDVPPDMAERGFGAIQVQFGPDAPEALRSAIGPDGTQDPYIAFGQADAAPPELQSWSIFASVLRDQSHWRTYLPPPVESLRTAVESYEKGKEPMRGGLLHFPHDRWIRHNQSGGIEPPPEPREWVFRFRPSDAWSGSLAQLWVWQNYLDLEEQQAGRKNLAPFVEVVEELLGHGQRIQIRQGRVTILRPHLGDEVRLDELPAGEQQILTLFGELARRMRPGAVVLIDEAEISLHPALQRSVLYQLRQLGRRYDLQIILTTHSMEIVSAVAAHEVVNLDDMVFREHQRQQDEDVP